MTKSHIQSGGGKPPRDLDGLVRELVVNEAEDSLWGTQFRQFLKQREKKDNPRRHTSNVRLPPRIL